MTKSQCFWSGSLITELFIPLGTIQPFIFISLTFCQSHIIRCAALLHGLGLGDHCASQRGQEVLLYPAVTPHSEPYSKEPHKPQPGLSCPQPCHPFQASHTSLLTLPSFSAPCPPLSRFLPFHELIRNPV